MLKKGVYKLILSSSVVSTGFAYNLQVMNSDLTLEGGISTGYFYPTNSISNSDKFIISDLLFRIISNPNNSPISLNISLGDINTPTVFDVPENYYPEIKAHNGTIIFNFPVKIELGLLEPVEGFESTHTFENPNVLTGAVASIEPYNAYGVRGTYNWNSLEFYYGFYGKRLDETEYCYEDLCRGDSWEVGVSGSVNGTEFLISYYDLNHFYNIVGINVSRDFGSLELATHLVYIFWDKTAKDYIRENFNSELDKSALGIAFYIIPKFNKFEFPLRLEYISQGKSQIFSDSIEANKIYSFSLTPTYEATEKSYLRAEITYTKADKTFENKEGKLKDNRIYIAVELGYLF